ncbi:hypothetical protein MNB_SV-6-812 [hydrothermal vent metagenome]|uniref:Uncharacterized protein n=1 Tax=hydrothermal vent metagenome TaxID=652676 RepID=A0A1W1BNB2_9ZZZZ
MPPQRQRGKAQAKKQRGLSLTRLKPSPPSFARTLVVSKNQTQFIST